MQYVLTKTNANVLNSALENNSTVADHYSTAMWDAKWDVFDIFLFHCGAAIKHTVINRSCFWSVKTNARIYCSILSFETRSLLNNTFCALQFKDRAERRSRVQHYALRNFMREIFTTQCIFTFCSQSLKEETLPSNTETRKMMYYT